MTSRHSRDTMANCPEKGDEPRDAAGMEFNHMGSGENQDDLLEEIEDLKSEIEEIRKRIPPHSVRYEIIQLLDEKEEELRRKKALL